MDLTRPRTVPELLRTSLGLLGRSPTLLLGLAVAVVAPFELIVYAVTRTAPLGQTSSLETVIVVAAIGFLVVGPLLSALYVNALVDLGQGVPPSISNVIATSLRALPVVVAAEIVAGLAIGAGLFAFVLPGIVLLVRLAVVAQVAALEGTDWPGAIRRGFALTRGNGWRILGVLLLVYLSNALVTQLGATVAGTGSNVPQLIVGIIVAMLEQSFTALTLAVLYFDLRTRAQTPQTPI